MFTSWLRRWTRPLSPPPARPPRGARVFPGVEVLEARWVPATVTTLSDGVPGSLRDAIASTPAGGTVDFQAGLSGTITLTGGTLTIDHDLTIAGPGATVLAVSGSQQFGVFSISSGVTAAIDGLTIADGNTAATFPVTRGGGLANAGTLTLTNSTVTGNVASQSSQQVFSSPGPPGLGPPFVISTVSGAGGGITNAGTLTIVNSTIAGNSVEPGGIGAPPTGGGIFNGAGGTLTITNSTITGNNAGQGGGIFSEGGSTLTVTNCTLAANTAAAGGGIYAAGAQDPAHPVTLTNTIVAGNLGPSTPDVSGAVSVAFNNLIGDGSGSAGLTNGVNGNLVGTAPQPIDPRLGFLQDNGGPTQTMALLPGSPALDAGTNAVTGPPLNLTTDQRGYPRQFGAAVDIGAFERRDPLSSYVAQLYHDTLDRQPNAGEVQAWVGALQSGALTPFQAASLFLASAEHVGLEVDHAYLAFLHRPDAPQERDLWAGALRAGTLTEHDLVLLFLTSPEYAAAHPGNGDFVFGLYNDLLQRHGNFGAGEVALWQGQLDSGALSRAQVATAFLSSSEALGLAVHGLYVTFLHRDESAAELQVWFQAIASGQVGGDTAVATFLSCPEYTGF